MLGWLFHSFAPDGLKQGRDVFDRRPCSQSVREGSEVTVVFIASLRYPSHADRVPMPHQQVTQAAGTAPLVPEAPPFKVHAGQPVYRSDVTATSGKVTPVAWFGQ